MKNRITSDRTIDEIGQIRAILRIDVELLRSKEGGRGVPELSEYSLASDNHKERLAGDRGRGANDMMKVLEPHRILLVIWSIEAAAQICLTNSAAWFTCLRG